MGLLVEVASFINRPRGMPERLADDVYRLGESLAFGVDMELRARGVRRSDFIQQRPNRRAFEEPLDLPVDWRSYERALLALDGVALPDGLEGQALRAAIANGGVRTPFPHLLGHADPPWYYVPREFPLPIWMPAPRAQLQPGAAPDGAARAISLGAVARLREELQALDALLTQRGFDAAQWLPAALLEAADVSLETGLPITVSNEE